MHLSRFIPNISKACCGSTKSLGFSYFSSTATPRAIMSRFQQKGLFVATFTPMKENGDINPDVVPAYIKYLEQHKIPGVFVNGTAGEGLSMTVSERKIMAEVWIKEARKVNMKTIIHCGAVCLRDAADLASHAQSLGADAIAAVPSFYFSPKHVDALVDGLSMIADAAPNTPFLYYHIPRMTNVDLDMSTFLKQAKARIPTLSGMKYSGFDLAGALKCLVDHGQEFEIMWGRDDVLLGALAIGINSFVGSTYNFTAPIANRIIQAFEAGDLETARTEQHRLKQVMDLTEKHGDQVSTFKAVTCMANVPLGPTRKPLNALDVRQAQFFQTGLKQMGYFDWVKSSD